MFCSVVSLGSDTSSGATASLLAAVREFGIGSLLVGRPDELEPLLRTAGSALESIEIVEASEVVTMDDPPTAAIRKKRNSGERPGSSPRATRAPRWSARRW